MSTCRSSSGQTNDSLRAPARGHVGLCLLASMAVLCFALTDVAHARPRDKRREAAAESKPAAGSPGGMPTTLTKTIAINSIIGALAINQSPAAEKTLERIVTGEVAFGGHGRQAAQLALLVLALQPTPAREAFLLRIFTDPDNVVRVGDQSLYRAVDLRIDAGHVLAKVGSPKLRLELAKLYTQSSTPVEVRGAIEDVVRSPSSANFQAQVEVIQSAEAPVALKTALQKILIEKNAAAVKTALHLQTDAKAGAQGAFPFSPAGGGSSATQNPAALLANAAKLLGAATSSPGKSPGTAAGNPFAAMLSGAKLPANTTTSAPKGAAPAHGAMPGFATAANMTPEMMMLKMLGQIQSLQPVDPGTVAHDLWNPAFVESISKKLTEGKSDETELVGALASLPIKAARERLKEFLHKERNRGPAELGKAETAKSAVAEPTLPPAAATMRRRGRRKKDDEGGFGAAADQVARSNLPRFGFGGGALNMGQSQIKKEITEFGTDWYDPGSLVVLKTVVTYQERPPEKPMHRPRYQIPANRMTPYMEKRMREKAEKQQALENTYEWRDAIEKSVRQWNERLSAVAEAPAEPQGAAENSSGADDKPAASTKTSKSSSDAKTSKAGSSKTPAAAPVATPSVPLPFALHAGATIEKEYHMRWPQDLAAGFNSATSDPLSVDYIRLQGQGEFGKALTHYRSAMMAVAGGKPKIFLRHVENGKWLDAVQKDASGHRTRSVDVIVTREAADDDKDKKSNAEALTVEILCVEIETPGSDATPGSSKKEARETTSTTSP